MKTYSSQFQKRYFRTVPAQLIGVAVLLLLCILIRPAGLSANNGFSYFGDYKTTVVPYLAAFLLYAFCLWKVSEAIGFNNAIRSIIAISFRVMAIMLVGLVITPSNMIDSLHTIFGATLFSLQLLISLWLAGWLIRNWINITLVVIEFLGGLMAFYYLPKPSGLLLQSQIIFQLAFVLLLVRLSLGGIPPVKLKRPSPSGSKQ